jgi:regulator of replication initiation timing
MNTNVNQSYLPASTRPKHPLDDKLKELTNWFSVLNDKVRPLPGTIDLVSTNISQLVKNVLPNMSDTLIKINETLTKLVDENSTMAISLEKLNREVTDLKTEVTSLKISLEQARRLESAPKSYHNVPESSSKDRQSPRRYSSDKCHVNTRDNRINRYGRAEKRRQNSSPIRPNEEKKRDLVHDQLLSVIDSHYDRSAKRTKTSDVPPDSAFRNGKHHNEVDGASSDQHTPNRLNRDSFTNSHTIIPKIHENPERSSPKVYETPRSLSPKVCAEHVDHGEKKAYSNGPNVGGTSSNEENNNCEDINGLLELFNQHGNKIKSSENPSKRWHK